MGNRAALDKEKAQTFSAKGSQHASMRAAWDQQMEEAQRKKDLERYGQEASLTSLQIGEMTQEEIDRCRRCKGPMPTGLNVNAGKLKRGADGFGMGVNATSY